MSNLLFTRREGLASAIAGGALLALPMSVLAQTSVPTGIVETAAGKVRGVRRQGISAFFGIPYGSDTGRGRFQPAGAAPAWAGVRDGFAWSTIAPQGVVNSGGARPGPGSNPEILKTIMTVFRAGMDAPLVQGEDCLNVNVFTPDASIRRKRPVMVWLHGGGFAIGSANYAQYEGSRLARRGDVVVVTVNHRLNALGYLYLGDLHPDFADSGNVGQLDIILALKWVRDNIAAFGGDPGNVTIFGESGGGAKVGTLLAMPAAKGLYHKAIIQSGPTVRMGEKADAVEVAERTLAALGVAKGDVHKLQAMDYKAVVKAAGSITLQPADRNRRLLSPIVDGRALPRHPYDPAPPEQSHNVPLMIGTCKDEFALFMALDPQFETMTADQARERFRAALGDKGDAAFTIYRAQRPDDKPTYWVTDLMTDIRTRNDSIRMAERKAAEGGAPSYMFRLDWHSPMAGGIFRAPHGLDTAMVFDNLATTPGMYGDEKAAQPIANRMADAWTAFARTGDPTQRGLAWPRYEAGSRKTMIFDEKTRIVADPDKARREYWV